MLHPALFVPECERIVRIVTINLTDDYVRKWKRDCREKRIPMIQWLWRKPIYSLGSRGKWKSESNGIRSHYFSIRKRDLALFLLAYRQDVRFITEKGDPGGVLRSKPINDPFAIYEREKI